MKEKFDLVKLLNILKKNIKLLVILPAICLVVSAVLTFFVMPDKYTASTQILVNMKKSSSDLAFQNVQSSLQSVNTYTEIIKSPRILDKVAREFDGEYTTTELNSFLKVTNQTNSQIITVSVTTGNKSESDKIVNRISKVFAHDMPKIMSVDNVTILSSAHDNAVKVSPIISVNLVISIIVGIVLAILIIFLKELLDKRIKTEEDVEAQLGLPILGSIQKF
ncbi:capsule biosynthesis protein CapA [Staphylococcus schweitzeri]|uniref:Capsule biosynthesis protein CapA n=1 Tax=Staphylococcus schweitzeri TaxID=1654388 RepID=A0A2K4AMA5_9STAP|nr:Wzz/FepE/Etk N-terminal domain-containing protein [Staphylococcus schweitzeri]MBE2128098.1 capsule biosynthesis protein CapA [Staphylococcus schweitzeri]PNZ50884.1 capsule biosynthesis protein CapA [Staphylococcus schweitzeri]CDR27022.1 chain length regulator (capsular polysaccharide biosynthesis) [Staphylococcus schweitzeri]CDR52116.1 chain length regulator (capsular polysaccharide biosynthesis) [Staphylococcus schweitzeri]CDR52865.1 chain length regulator (capsular polysaccharide biosynth